MIKESLLPIQQILQTYQPIDLLAMDAVKLMDRVDTKYVLTLPQTLQLLQAMQPNYAVLEIDSLRIIPYQSEYFDTPTLSCFHENQRGKLSRQKLRIRTYGNNGQSYLELKTKINKGRTVKIRTQQLGETTWQENTANIALLAENSVLQVQNLSSQVTISYQRCTLVDLKGQARITFDFGLEFSKSNGPAARQFNQLVIIEIKQNKITQNAIAQWLKANTLRPGSINKYCLGMISLYPDLKKNRFKKRYLQLLKKAAFNDNSSVL
jgi:hypothetical protein